MPRRPRRYIPGAKPISTPQYNQLHDSLVEKIQDSLDARGYETHHHVEYGTEQRVVGEIDLYAEKDGYVVAVEAKYNHSGQKRRQALDQLERMAKHFFAGHRVFYFYAHSTQDGFNLEWVRRNYRP